MTPSVSIVIPVYNNESYLCECINSVLASSFTDFELLLIDDGSTDNSPSICEEYVKADSRVTAFHKQNGGPSSVRNMGIEKSRAEWVAFVDADDFVGSTYLEHLYNGVKKHPDTDFVHAGFTNVRNGKICEVEQSYSPYHGSDMNLLCPIYRGRPYSKLYKRRLLEGVRFDERIHSSEDLVFTTDYLVHVLKYSLLSEVGYYYRCDNEQSVLHSTRSNTYEERLHFFKHQFEGAMAFVKVHQISADCAQMRFTQMADSMVYAVFELYRGEALSRTHRLSHLKHDFSNEHLSCLKNVSGKKNRLLFALLANKKYSLFDTVTSIIFK